MKQITVSFDIAIDDAEWQRQYPDDAADLPAAVNRYARNVVEGLFTDLGLANA
ncbi:hypothetical protein [Mycobacterium asiaticum]|uniref:hypothetical protein n=1 Tax=Mycobacterium asiaticum TaxID=1790 RepID=UPI000AADC0AE|nr:hypothetical protein [Mycobacterium asiaticum]